MNDIADRLTPSLQEQIDDANNQILQCQKRIENLKKEPGNHDYQILQEETTLRAIEDTLQDLEFRKRNPPDPDQSLQISQQE